MPKSVSLPLFFLGVLFSCIALVLLMAALGFLGWPPGLIIAASLLLMGFLVSYRFERDMSLQKRDAERRTEARERERAETFATLRSRIVQGFASPLLMIDSGRTVVEANRQAREMFGPDIVGNDLSFYVRQPSALDAVRETIETGRPVQQEIQISAPVERFYTVVANRIDQTDTLNPQMQPTYYVVIALQDITKSKLSDRMRVDFIANASHELRTPLSALIGFIETLSGPAANDPEAQERFLKIMGQEADRMIRVIDDLLSLSRIELGKHVAPQGQVNMVSIAENIDQMFQVALESQDREIRLTVNGQIPDITGDQDQITQVFQNLIANALKYSRAGTPIDVTISMPSQAHVQVEFKDQGEGIAPEHLPRLTERFYRVDTARSRQIGGTGLGLAIVKHITERHGGDMQIASTVGVGTTITLDFPVDYALSGEPDEDRISVSTSGSVHA